MTPKDFISFVKKECAYYGVKCSLRKGTFIIYDKQRSSGCFDDTSMTLVCALGRNDSLGILAHEYCHMRQWVEKCPEWLRANEFKSYETWNKHIAGKKVDMGIHFEIMRDLELDNERRTVSLIKKFDLPIDVKLYTQKANAYVMLYNYMKITGRWPSSKNTPYTNVRVYSAMPDKFSLNYNIIPPRLEKIYREEGI